MASDSESSSRKQWIGPVVTTLVGIAATLGVGWYQLNRSEREAALAEQERSRAVRQNIVAIVEEHVLNDKPIELTRLARLIDQRQRDEHLTTNISTPEVIEQAEYNILNSRYLPFERKQALKPIFDGLYNELVSGTFKPFHNNTPHDNLANEVARDIQEGKPKDALQALTRLQDSYRHDAAYSLIERRAGLSFKDLVLEMVGDPWNLLALPAFLFAVFFLSDGNRLQRVIRAIIGAPLRQQEPPDEHT